MIIVSDSVNDLLDDSEKISMNIVTAIHDDNYWFVNRLIQKSNKQDMGKAITKMDKDNEVCICSASTSSGIMKNINDIKQCIQMDLSIATATATAASNWIGAESALNTILSKIGEGGNGGDYEIVYVENVVQNNGPHRKNETNNVCFIKLSCRDETKWLGLKKIRLFDFKMGFYNQMYFFKLTK